MRQTLTLLTPPELLPLTLDETKAFLRVETEDDDELIGGLIAAGTAHIDGRDGWIGRALMHQQWELRLDHFPGLMPGGMLSLRDDGYPSRIQIPLPPLVSVDLVNYVDSDGVLQVLDPSTYQIVKGGFGKAQLALAYAQVWPATLWQPDAVRIQFTCGYASENGLPPGSPGAVPADIMTALKLLISHWYAHREAVVGVESRDSSTELPLGVQALLSAKRIGLG